MSDAPKNPRVGCWAALVLVVLIVAALAAYLFHRAETWPARAAAQVRRAFEQIGPLQPRVSIRDRVIFEQTATALELATATRETQVEREMEQSWLGSKKRIKLRGVYRVRAGFDLRKTFDVRIEGSRVLVEVPPPKILGADQIDVEVLSYEQGMWNKIRPDELEAELRTLPQTARLKAAESQLQQEALESFTKQLREKLAPQLEVEVRVAVPVLELAPAAIGLKRLSDPGRGDGLVAPSRAAAPSEGCGIGMRATRPSPLLDRRPSLTFSLPVEP